MKQILMNYKKKVIMLAFIGLITNLAYVLTPLLIGFIINDAVVGSSIGSTEYTLLLSVLLLYTVQLVSAGFYYNMGAIIALEIVSDLRNKLEEKITLLPISYLDTHAHGAIQNYFSNDSEVIYEGIYQGLTQGVSGVMLLLITTIFMLFISPLLTLIVFVTLPIVYYTSSFITKRGIKYFKETQKLGQDLNGMSSEYLEMNRLVMLYNYQDRAITNFNDLNRAYDKVGVKAQIISALVNPTTRLVNNISYILVGLGGIVSIKYFGLSVGFLTTFISYSIMFSKPFNEVSGVMSQITSAVSSYTRMMEFLEVQDELRPSKDIELSGKTIRFEDVSFAYNPEYPIIQDFNLDVLPLSKVAIVGPTGAGKSTLINLLMRFYAVDTGVIYEDDENIADVSMESTRKTMGMVLQEPWLFEGTVRENLLFGKEDATTQELEEALVQAGCLHIVESLEDGLDTMITLGSTNLSLGEKQLLTIARALVSKAPILILDEATSNVDILTEKHIQSVFTQIMKSHTSFFIAHHLSTVVDSDLILVMNKGKLVESGTHTELMESQGFYYNLYTSNKPMGN